MRKFTLIFLVSFLSVVIKAQQHTIFVSPIYNLKVDNSIYIDFDEPDYTVWSEPDNNFSWRLGYAYNLTECIGIGIQTEFEKIEFEDFYLGDVTANRLVYGLFFQAKYPKNAIHGQAGGYFNVGSVKSDEMDDDLSGMEYGLFVGPAYTFGDFEMSLLFRPKFSYFFSDATSPESSLIMYPGISLKIAYTLKAK